MSDDDLKQNTIDLAERLLRLCRTGEVRGFVAVLQTRTTMEFLEAGDYVSQTMIAGLEVLKRVQVDEILEETYPEIDRARIAAVPEAPEGDQGRPGWTCENQIWTCTCGQSLPERVSSFSERLRLHERVCGSHSRELRLICDHASPFWIYLEGESASVQCSGCGKVRTPGGGWI